MTGVHLEIINGELGRIPYHPGKENRTQHSGQKTYNFLEEEDTHLFSGFVQAITAIGKQIAQKDPKVEITEKQTKYSKHMMEIDFKYFYALIYDYKELRIVFILSERSSENFREKLKGYQRSLQ